MLICYIHLNLGILDFRFWNLHDFHLENKNKGMQYICTR